MSEDKVQWDCFPLESLEAYRDETIDNLEFYHDRLVKIQKAINEKRGEK